MNILIGGSIALILAGVVIVVSSVIYNQIILFFKDKQK